jgi:hypothetical protein
MTKFRSRPTDSRKHHANRHRPESHPNESTSDRKQWAQLSRPAFVLRKLSLSTAEEFRNEGARHTLRLNWTNLGKARQYFSVIIPTSHACRMPQRHIFHTSMSLPADSRYTPQFRHHHLVAMHPSSIMRLTHQKRVVCLGSL